MWAHLVPPHRSQAGAVPFLPQPKVGYALMVTRLSPIPEGPTALGKRLGVSRQRAHALLYPKEALARRLLHDAVATGGVVPPKTCSSCNKEAKVEGHHPDYKLPLAVIWVCSGCHSKVHPHHPRSRNPDLIIIPPKRKFDSALPFDECVRCGHRWNPRTLERTRQCKKCHSRNWDKEA